MTIEEARREIDSLDFYLQNHTDDYSEESHIAMVMAIKALEMQKKLAEFSGMDICNWVEDYDFEENNISEYEYEASVDNFLIDKEE